MSTRRLPRSLFPLTIGIASFTVFLVGEFIKIPVWVSLTIASILLIAYVFLETNYLRRVHPNRWLLNPVVLCSIGTIAIGYGFTNAVFLLPYEDILGLGWTPGVTESMVRLVWLSLLAAIALWMGYWSLISSQLSRPAFTSKVRIKILPQTDWLRKFALPGLIFASVFARLIQIRLGIFGYSSSYELLIQYSSITQYLSLVGSLGLLALVLASLQFYSRPGLIGAKQWFYGVLLLELAFGFLSGFKSAVVMPFVVAVAAKYLITARVPKEWLVALPFAILAAYAVVEPFRAERNFNAEFSGNSVDGIVTAMMGANKYNRRTQVDRGGVGLSLLGRSNLTYPGSFGIEYGDENPVLPEGSPEFLKSIFMAPVYALIPRALWPSKPTGTLGLWYNRVVMGMWTYSSTAMGPVTYLYLAGGLIAIFVGFYLLGMVQRLLFFVLSPAESMPGAVVLLAMLGSLGTIGSNFDSLVVTLFRDLPLVVVLQHFLFRRQNKNRDSTQPFHEARPRNEVEAR